jgi:UDP:flavonoid glycosyltransferase YjiC (YdhE family)
MKITIVAYGTRGDVQPVLALGRGLAAAGHRVRMVASSNFRDWIERHGLEAAATSADAQEVMRSDDGRLWAEQGTKPFTQVRLMRRMARQTYPQMLAEAWAACAGADAVVSTATTEPFAVAMAERLGVPHVTALVAPAFVPTRSGPAAWLAPLPGRESAINYAAGKLLYEAAFYRVMPDLVATFRRETLGLPKESIFRYAAGQRRRPVLLGYSEHVVPHPSDWPSTFHTTGYWFLDDEPDWEPPAALVEFLEAGEPPVCIGFGSMGSRDPGALTRLVLDAVARSGRRAVLLSGWGALDGSAMPAGVFRLDEAPHAWLFPRTAAIVHHGGSGTTAAALRAGRPMVVVPHLGDQPYWGQRMRALGVAPAPIPRPKLTAERLGRAIAVASSDEGMRRRAGALGREIGADDGVAVAVRLVERYLR